MKSKERVLTAVHLGLPDRVPMDFHVLQTDVSTENILAMADAGAA
jgi:hypothetical protein